MSGQLGITRLRPSRPWLYRRDRGLRGGYAVGTLWFWWLASGLVLIVAFYLLPAAGPAQDLRVALRCLLTASPVAAIAIGLRRYRPTYAIPWIILAFSQALYTTGNVIFYTLNLALGDTAFPSEADIFFVARLPFAMLGLALLAHRRMPGRQLPVLLDTATITVAACMLSWLYLIAPQISQDTRLLVALTSASYPTLDLGLLIIVILMLLGPGRRTTPFFMLVASLGLTLAADAAYTLQQLHGTYQAGNLLDALWSSGDLLLGVAALHPAMAELGEPCAAPEPRTGPARLVALFGATLMAPIALIYHADNDPGTIRFIGVVSTLLASLIFVRMWGLVSEQRRLAITDGLTGLRTRRFLDEQLGLELARSRRSGMSVALYIIDVDHFKSVNDRFGHPAGDRVLREIADRLRGVTRPGDVLARYGGEEFALVAPNTGPGDLYKVGERLLRSVSDTQVDVGSGCRLHVSVSIGAAGFPTHVVVKSASSPQPTTLCMPRRKADGPASWPIPVKPGRGLGRPEDDEDDPARPTLAQPLPSETFSLRDAHLLTILSTKTDKMDASYLSDRYTSIHA